MRVGVQFPTWALDHTIGRRNVELWAEQVDRAGFFSLWVADHLFFPQHAGQVVSKHERTAVLPSEQYHVVEMLESWSTLAFAAGRTTRVKLGTLVTGVMLRHPAVLVKLVNTLDALSDGRAYMGVGVGWEEEEHQRLGIAFPPLAERFERLEELLQIAMRMWIGEDKPYGGRYYQLSSTASQSLCVQRPHPPVLIGGGGEQKTLRLVAQYADACNIGSGYGLDGLRRKLAVLQEHCRSVKRPYEAIEKTTAGIFQVTRDGRQGTLSPQAVIEQFAELAALGFDQVIMLMWDSFDQEVFDILATQVIPVVEKIPVLGR